MQPTSSIKDSRAVSRMGIRFYVRREICVCIHIIVVIKIHMLYSSVRIYIYTHVRYFMYLMLLHLPEASTVARVTGQRRERPTAFGQARWAFVLSTSRGPRDHVNIGIQHAGFKAQAKVDSRNHCLWILVFLWSVRPRIIGVVVSSRWYLVS